MLESTLSLVEASKRLGLTTSGLAELVKQRKIEHGIENDSIRIPAAAIGGYFLQKEADAERKHQGRTEGDQEIRDSNKRDILQKIGYAAFEIESLSRLPFARVFSRYDDMTNLFKKYDAQKGEEAAQKLFRANKAMFEQNDQTFAVYKIMLDEMLHRSGPTLQATFMNDPEKISTLARLQELKMHLNRKDRIASQYADHDLIMRIESLGYEFEFFEEVVTNGFKYGNESFIGKRMIPVEHIIKNVSSPCRNDAKKIARTVDSLVRHGVVLRSNNIYSLNPHYSSAVAHEPLKQYMQQFLGR